jgi:hypothetical protein
MTVWSPMQYRWMHCNVCGVMFTGWGDMSSTGWQSSRGDSRRVRPALCGCCGSYKACCCKCGGRGENWCWAGLTWADGHTANGGFRGWLHQQLPSCSQTQQKGVQHGRLVKVASSMPERRTSSTYGVDAGWLQPGVCCCWASGRCCSGDRAMLGASVTHERLVDVIKQH